VGIRHLFTSSAGVQHYIEDDGEHEAGKFRIHSRFPFDSEVLEKNKAMATHNDGYNADRSMRRVASIPVGLLLYWRSVEGWDALHPHNANKLKEKLNSSEFLWLRTAPGKL